MTQLVRRAGGSYTLASHLSQPESQLANEAVSRNERFFGLDQLFNFGDSVDEPDAFNDSSETASGVADALSTGGIQVECE